MHFSMGTCNNSLIEMYLECLPHHLLSFSGFVDLSIVKAAPKLFSLRIIVDCQEKYSSSAKPCEIFLLSGSLKDRTFALHQCKGMPQPFNGWDLSQELSKSLKAQMQDSKTHKLTPASKHCLMIFLACRRIDMYKYVCMCRASLVARKWVQSLILWRHANAFFQIEM